MIKVNEIAFVAYPTTDKQRARDFYEAILGLKLTLNMDMPEGYWVEYEVGASTLALSNFWKPSAEPAMGPTVAIEVEDFETTIAMLKTKGVVFAKETFDSSVCRMAMILDPDGNSLWIHKRNPGRGSDAGNEIPFTCYPVTDRKRASDFYGGIFGLVEASGHAGTTDFWFEYEIGTETLAMCDGWKPSAEPSMGPCIAFELEDFDAAVTELRAKAIPFAMEPLETPGCFMAVVTDPDGNSLFIHKRKPGRD